MKLRLLLAVLVLAPCGPATAQELGRLFFTPEQRAALEARRKARIPDKPAAQAVQPGATRIDGHVMRQDGRSTVWVNGVPVEGREARDRAVQPHRRDPSRVAIPDGEGGQQRELRVGQSLDHGTGEVRDPLQGAVIRRDSPAPGGGRKP